MRKQSSKARGVKQIAAEILEEAVGKPAPITPVGKKNPAAANVRRAGDAKEGALGAKRPAPRKRKAPTQKTVAARGKVK